MTRKTPPKPIEIATDPAQYTPRCPKCNAAIISQATVEVFGEPAKPHRRRYHDHPHPTPRPLRRP
jgi:hypothetical protein